jgi:hypothetical protein
MSVTATIEKLNSGTFAAEMQQNVESEDWRSYLDRVLADDFSIRRSDPRKATENKAAFLAAVAAGPGPIRRVVPNRVRTWCSDTVAVAVSLVEVEGRTEHFQNCKVFTSIDGEWRCVLWQVTAGP